MIIYILLLRLPITRRILRLLVGSLMPLLGGGSTLFLYGEGRNRPNNPYSLGQVVPLESRTSKLVSPDASGKYTKSPPNGVDFFTIDFSTSSIRNTSTRETT